MGLESRPADALVAGLTSVSHRPFSVEYLITLLPANQHVVQL